MNTKEMFIKKFNENKTFFLSFVPAAAILFILSSLLLVYPQSAAEGVKKGISVCLETVIPSLFPFLLVTTTAYDMGAFDNLSAKAEKLTSVLFSLPGVAFPIIFMSLLGGFPVGANLIEKAFDKGELTSSQAQRMLMFCVNPGPAFAVSAIGVSVLNSKQAGIIIYISVTLSSLLVGFFTRFISSEKVTVNIHKNIKPLNCHPSVLTCAINSSTKSMINICAWILVFGCIGSLADALSLNKTFLLFFKMFSEVTNGAIVASGNFTIPVIAAVISFAGFCVHFQIMPCIIKLHMKYKHFLAVRILSAALACSFTFLFIRLFPQSSEVISLGAKPQTASFEVSFPVCVWLMFMCGLFIIGDNYVFSKKTRKTDRQYSSLY